jgi:uncharacterized protein YjiS (DUF1127 family)
MTTLVANTFDRLGLSSWWKRYQESVQRNRAYKHTLHELEKLSDAELKDIGLSRGDIRSIAMETHYDNRSVR